MKVFALNFALLPLFANAAISSSQRELIFSSLEFPTTHNFHRSLEESFTLSQACEGAYYDLSNNTEFWAASDTKYTDYLDALDSCITNSNGDRLTCNIDLCECDIEWEERLSTLFACSLP